jgi:serine/threonine-protein kinase
VYSLGCVLYECLTGQSPFPRATDVALLWAHVHEEPTPPSKARPELPKELDTVLARALAKEPGRRYRSAGELVAATRSALRLVEPAPAAARPRSRLLLVGAAVLAALVLAALAALVFSRGDSGGLSAVSPNHVGVIDANSNKLVAEVQVGRDPESVAFGYGSVWVASVKDQIVSQIDPSDVAATPATIAVMGDYPADITTGLGAVWVAGGALAELVRINPAQGTASDPVPAAQKGVGCGSPYASLAVGEGSVWFLCEGGGAFGRFDPSTSNAQDLLVQCGLAIFSTSRLPRYTDMAYGPDALWITNYAGNQVLRLDPVVCQEPEPLSAGAGPMAVAVGGSAVWVANFDADTVTKIGVSGSAPVQSTFDVGDGPVDLAVDENAVWVANQLDRTVVRLDPETGDVEAKIDLGNVPQGIAVGEGRVWVTVRAPEDETP